MWQSLWTWAMSQRWEHSEFSELWKQYQSFQVRARLNTEADCCSTEAILTFLKHKPYFFPQRKKKKKAGIGRYQNSLKSLIHCFLTWALSFWNQPLSLTDSCMRHCSTQCVWFSPYDVKLSSPHSMNISYPEVFLPMCILPTWCYVVFVVNLCVLKIELF